MTTFISFNTSCGCSKMMMAMPDWQPEPYITIPLSFPVEAKDWLTEELTDDQVMPQIAQRRFRLEREDFLAGVNPKRIYSYVEMRN